MSNIAERLAKMQEAFHGAKAQYDQRFGGVKVDEGEYKGVLSRCSLDIRKSDNALVMSVEYTIVGGKFTGFTTFDQMNLDNEWGRLYAIRFTEISGYEFPEDVSVLEATVKAIAKQAGTYIIEAKQNGDYTNIIPKQLLEEKAEVPAPVQSTPVPVSTPVTAGKSTARQRTAPAVVPVAVPAPAPAPAPAPVKKAATTPSAMYDTPQSDTTITVESIATMDRKMLKQVIVEKDIEFRVTTKHSDDDIRTAIIAGLGLVSSEQETPVTEQEDASIPTDDELKLDLLVFCKSQRIKSVTKEMTLDEMLNILDGFEFKGDELEADEVKLLTMLAMDKCIK